MGEREEKRRHLFGRETERKGLRLEGEGRFACLGRKGGGVGGAFLLKGQNRPFHYL